jgi:hypothetical protein
MDVVKMSSRIILRGDDTRDVMLDASLSTRLIFMARLKSSQCVFWASFQMRTFFQLRATWRSSATSDDSLKVMAVCLEEYYNGRGFTILVAAYTGDLSAVPTGFVRFARVLEHVARQGWAVNLLPYWWCLEAYIDYKIRRKEEDWSLF